MGGQWLRRSMRLLKSLLVFLKDSADLEALRSCSSCLPHSSANAPASSKRDCVLSPTTSPVAYRSTRLSLRRLPAGASRSTDLCRLCHMGQARTTSEHTTLGRKEMKFFTNQAEPALKVACTTNQLHAVLVSPAFFVHSSRTCSWAPCLSK